MPDSAQALLLFEIVQDAPFRIGIDIIGVFIDIVQQVEIKVSHAALFQLFLKDFRWIVAGGDLVARIFVRQEPFLPRIPCQCFPDGNLAVAAVIGPGGIKIVHTMRNGIIYHLLKLLLINSFFRSLR